MDEKQKIKFLNFYRLPIYIRQKKKKNTFLRII